MICVLALLASACFSAAEVAIFSIRTPVLKMLQERREPRVRWIEEVLAQPRKYLTTLLLGNVAANAILACGLVFLTQETGKTIPFSKAPAIIGLFPAAAPSVFSWWPLVLVTAGIVLIFGEMIPKAVAARVGIPVALRLVGPLRLIERLLHPFTSSMDRFAHLCAVRLSPPSLRPLRGLTEDEYITMLDVGAREGALSPVERQLIQRTLHLSDRNLRELMTPRSEMCCLDAELEFAEIKKRAAAMRHRRLPIYSESPDSVVGILNVRRFLLETEGDLIACIEPPAFVPETMTALELLKNFLRGPQRMALVVDEFGGVEGLITLEDIVEEVFGEIYDEYDDDSPAWDEIEPGVFVMRGSAHLPAVSQWLGIEIEADGVDTLGGWLTDRLGVLPKVGDRHLFLGWSFQVEKMQRLRVGKVLVRDERRKRK